MYIHMCRYMIYTHTYTRKEGFSRALRLRWRASGRPCLQCWICPVNICGQGRQRGRHRGWGWTGAGCLLRDHLGLEGPEPSQPVHCHGKAPSTCRDTVGRGQWQQAALGRHGAGIVGRASGAHHLAPALAAASMQQVNNTINKRLG